MASRAAKSVAKAFGAKSAKPKGKHPDKKQDTALIKAAVKPAALKKPQGFAVGGAAKQRLGQATDTGRQAPRLTAPVKTQKKQPRRVM